MFKYEYITGADGKEYKFKIKCNSWKIAKFVSKKGDFHYKINPENSEDIALVNELRRKYNPDPETIEGLIQFEYEQVCKKLRGEMKPARILAFHVAQFADTRRKKSKGTK